MIPMMLLVIGTITAVIKKNKDMIFMIISFLFMITVIYGIGPSLSFIKRLPIFNSSSSTRLLMLLAFTGSIISAYGVSNFEFITKRISKITLKYQKIFLVLVVVLPLLLLATVFFSQVSLESILQQNSLKALLVWLKDSEYKYFIYHLLNFSLLYLTAVFVCVLLYIGSKSNQLVRYILYFIIILSFAELSIYSIKQISNLTPALHYPKTQSIKYLQDNTDELERIIKTDFAIGPSGTEVYFDLHNIYDHDFYTVQERDYLRKPMRKGRENFLVTATYPSVHYDDLDYSSEVLDELNVKYIVFPPTISLNEIEKQPDLKENFRQVYNRVGDLNIYENKGGYSPIHWESGEKMNAEVEVIKDGYERFVVTNNHGTDKFYTSQLYYDKWKVYVDGDEAELKSVHDGLFRAVELDKGKSTVEFIYESGKLYRYGFIYAAAMYVFIIGFHLYQLYQFARQRIPCDLYNK
jgi:hypothetical protein